MKPDYKKIRQGKLEMLRRFLEAKQRAEVEGRIKFKILL